MKQLPFEWALEPEHDDRIEFELTPAATEAVIALMARILINVVRPSKEASDER